MFPSRIPRRVRLVAIGGALVVGLALPGAVSADTTGVPSIQPAFSRDATIQVTSVAVTAKVIATVSIAFTCQPFQSYDWETGQTIETTVGRIEGGDVVWQMFDASNKPIPATAGRIENAPAWDFPAVAARADQTFVIVY